VLADRNSNLLKSVCQNPKASKQKLSIYIIAAKNHFYQKFTKKKDKMFRAGAFMVVGMAGVCVWRRLLVIGAIFCVLARR